MEIQITPLSTAVQLSDALRQVIQRGDLTPGTAIPSERMLCEKSGLSRMTVRRAIQQLVDEGFLYRQAGSGTFVGRRKHAETRNALLGLVVPSLANPFYGELADVVAHEAEKNDLQLVIGRSQGDPISEIEHLRRIGENPDVKGILISPSGSSSQILHHDIYNTLKERGIPIVFMVRKPETFSSDLVMTDHIAGAELITRYLIDQGHRRIAFIGQKFSLPNRHYKGYVQGLAYGGLTPDPELVIAAGTKSEEAGYEGAKIFLQRGGKATAIFARTDASALGVYAALSEAGKRIPQDFSVVGFDNITTSRHLSPPLTTIDHPLSELARMAVFLSLDRITRRYNGSSRTVIINPTVIERESSAPPNRTD